MPSAESPMKASFWVRTVLSTEATVRAEPWVPGAPTVPSSYRPNASSSTAVGEKFCPSLPAAITVSTPAPRAASIARPAASEAFFCPFGEPSDMLITSASSFTESSMAATMSESAAPPPVLENTFIARIWAFGATPSMVPVSVTSVGSSPGEPLAAAMPATCWPWASTVASLTTKFSSA